MQTKQAGKETAAGFFANSVFVGDHSGQGLGTFIVRNVSEDVDTDSKHLEFSGFDWVNDTDGLSGDNFTGVETGAGDKDVFDSELGIREGISESAHLVEELARNDDTLGAHSGDDTRRNITRIYRVPMP